jgi:peptidoglycan/LPS O-acetylase OafA/YrhL
MAWGFWLSLGCVAVTILTPFAFRPRSPRWRRYRRAGLVLAPLALALWVGFFHLDPGSPGWLYFPCLGVVILASAALVFAGSVCAGERNLHRESDGPAVER